MIILSIIIVPVIMFALYVKIEAKQDRVLTKDIGELQFDLLQTYQRGEKTLLYIDQAAKYSMYHSVFDFFGSGGLFNSECGQHNGYQIWQNKEQECYLTKESIENNFPMFVNENLN